MTDSEIAIKLRDIARTVESIDRKKNEETEHRLHVWQTVGQERPYGKWAIKGATAGSAYGTASCGNIEALKKIN